VSSGAAGPAPPATRLAHDAASRDLRRVGAVRSLLRRIQRLPKELRAQLRGPRRGPGPGPDAPARPPRPSLLHEPLFGAAPAHDLLLDPPPRHHSAGPPRAHAAAALARNHRRRRRGGPELG